MSKEAMKLALEALIGAIEAARTDVAHYAALDFDMCEDALQSGYAALEALAKQEQRSDNEHMGEPVGEVSGHDWSTGLFYRDLEPGTPLYTTPQQRKPLTDWQPIETAPTKGRELILLLTPSKWPQVAYTNTWWTSGFSVENKPTHWMPIPPPHRSRPRHYRKRS